MLREIGKVLFLKVLVLEGKEFTLYKKICHKRKHYLCGISKSYTFRSRIFFYIKLPVTSINKTCNYVEGVEQKEHHVTSEKVW